MSPIRALKTTKNVCITKENAPTSGYSGKSTVQSKKAPAWKGRGKAADKKITGRNANIWPKFTST